MPPGEGEDENKTPPADDAGGSKEADDTEELEDGEGSSDDEEHGAFNATAHINALIEERGGGEKAARALARKFFWENKKLRGKLRSAKKRVVGDKDLVLKGAEADGYKKLTALGKPDEIVKKIGEHGALQKKIQETEREKSFSDVADALGFTSKRGKRAFVEQAKLKGLDIQDREVVEEDPESKKKTKTIRTFARLIGEADDKFRPVEEFVEDDLRDYLPAFEAEDDDEQSEESDTRESVTRDTRERRRVTPMVSQSRSATRTTERPERAAVKGTLSNRYAPREKKK